MKFHFLDGKTPIQISLKISRAKKKIFAIIALFLFKQAYSMDFSLQLIPSYGFSLSDISELVYENNVKESQIRWKNYKPVLGIDTECSLQNFIIDFKIHNSIPVALGNVIDKDFFLDETNDISMYSEHDLITDKDYLFKLDLSYQFILPLLTVGLGLSGVYSNTKMEAVDGFLQYPSDGSSWKKTSHIKANVLLGLKGLKVLGIIGDLGYSNEWPLMKHEEPVIPETPFFQYKVN